jgi:hypothetical protein
MHAAPCERVSRVAKTRPGILHNTFKPHRITGMEYSAPSLIPLGQREVTVFVRV